MSKTLKAKGNYPAVLENPNLAGKVMIRSEETVSDYRIRYTRLLNATLKSMNENDVSIRQVAEYVKARAPVLMPSSYRQDVSSVLQKLRDYWVAEEITSDAEVVAIVSIMRFGEGEEKKFRPKTAKPRTSSGRAKSAPQLTIEKIEADALKLGTADGMILAGILNINAELGLRPTELFDALLKDRDLYVKCAKYSLENGRGIAAYRQITLPQNQFSDNRIQALKVTLTRLQVALHEAKGDRMLVLKRLSELLRNLRGKTKITLRTLRHQCRTNLKSSGYSKAEIAALFGHISADTNLAWYGKSRSDWGIDMTVEPDPKLVKKVKPGANTSSKIKRGLATTWDDASINAGLNSKPKR